MHLYYRVCYAYLNNTFLPTTISQLYSQTCIQMTNSVLETNSVVVHNLNLQELRFSWWWMRTIIIWDDTVSFWRIMVPQFSEKHRVWRQQVPAKVR